MNTRISYLYRDAANYKVLNSVVISGELSDKQIEVIIGCLDEEGYFIPSQVGLPEVKFEDTNEDDHCWFELDKKGFEKTDEEPTVEINANELYERFMKAKDNWDDSVKN